MNLSYGCNGVTWVLWVAIITKLNLVTAWLPHPPPSVRLSPLTVLRAKGFGSVKSTKPGEASSNQGASGASTKAILKQVQKKYDGATAHEIALGTQRLLDQALNRLPVHLQLATKLYQQLCQWNAKLDTMTLLDHASMPPTELDGARRAQAELERLYVEHNVTATDLHNLFQQMTWDASADAKVARSLSGAMPAEIAQRIERACAFVSDAVRKDGIGRCLDVGCGFGTLVPILGRTLPLSSIHGIDLSPEMIRNARLLYPDCHFTAGDFVTYQPSLLENDSFDAILFCSSLHDFPDWKLALTKALSLLSPQGCLVIVHAQGARHVQQQVEANPVLVRRGLPDADELRALVASTSSLQCRLLLEPAQINTPRDLSEGYLAVLTKL